MYISLLPLLRSLIQKFHAESEQLAYFAPSSPTGGLGQLRSTFWKPITDGAAKAVDLHSKMELPSEDEVVKDISATGQMGKRTESPLTKESSETSKDLIISFRAAFSGLVVSLVDSAPSEIAVATFKNMNAIATWDMLRNTDSTIYITVTGIQIDNMVPNAPFPVAVCPFDLQRGTPNNDGTETEAGVKATPPLLVVGLSFAPRHKSGIVVSF